LLWTNILADAGYSSGENYAMLEREQLQSFIPPHGTYKGGPDGFEYFKDGDYWVCPQGKQVTYRKNKIEKGTLKRYYYTRRKDCKGCPIKDTCIGKSFEKKIAITAYKDQYDRAIKRVKSTQGKYMRKKRLSTVEPVFGTLINFMGMRKINTIGMVQANKVMLLAAIAYNLKKYLNHKVTHAESMVNSLNLNKYRLFAEIKRFYNLFYHRFLIFTLESGVIKIQNI
jgi:hypothetical protein